MPFDGSGNFVPLSLPDFPAIGGQPIYASQFNNVVTDLMNGFGSVLTRDGQSSLTGNLQMAGNRVTGLAVGAATGQALTFGQAGAQLGDLTLSGALSVTGAGTFTDSVTVNKSGSTAAAFLQAGNASASFLAGYNGSAGLSPISTPASAAFLGSAQAVNLHFGLGGVAVASLLSTGDFTVTGNLAFKNQLNGYGTAGQPTQVVNRNGGGFEFYNTGSTLIASLAGTGVLTAAGFVGPLTGNVTGSVSGSAGSVPWSGVTGRPTTLAGYGITDGSGAVSSVFGRTGAVTLGSGDVTGALGYTPLSGISGSMVTTALGFTPYNSSNPSGFISGITSSMVVIALGYIPSSRASFSVTTTDTYSGSNLGYGAYIGDASLAYNAGTGVFTFRRNYLYAQASGGGV